MADTFYAIRTDSRSQPQYYRAVDGVAGAALLGAFKALIENPVLMVV